ncbi:unnamed protein product [Dovyalis caffra]|uniref:Uncharacterized protein n=1 Tax=Dovyalis caffra TaxID=77055 RepID=A0AAV1RW31_9ROSI|nr:unnamed protein product [Dovyalis caffra]
MVIKRNIRNEAVKMVRVYIGEAITVNGPIFVEMVTRMEIREGGGGLCRKRGDGQNEGFAVNVGGGEGKGLVKKIRKGVGSENGVLEVNVGGSWNEAVEMVRVYLGEAVTVNGPMFVEMVTRMEIRERGGGLCWKRGDGQNEGFAVNVGGGEGKGLVKKSRKGGGSENGVLEVNVGGSWFILMLMLERDVRVEMVRVYLGEAGAVSGLVFVEMFARMELRERGGVLCRKREGGQNEGVELVYINVDAGEGCLRVCIDVDAEEGCLRLPDGNLEPADNPGKESFEGGGGENVVMKVNMGGCRVFIDVDAREGCLRLNLELGTADMPAKKSRAQNQSRRDADACNPSVNHPVEPSAENLNQTEVDVANPSTNQTVVPSNATARTFEWDDAIDGSPEGTGDQMNRFRLDSPKRSRLSIEETQTGTEITEVDSKDKSRNITKIYVVDTVR